MRDPRLNILPSNILDRHTNAVLECNVDAFPMANTYSWYFQSIHLPSEISRQLIVNNVTENNIGLYTCSVDFHSNTYTASAQMIVNCKFVFTYKLC